MLVDVDSCWFLDAIQWSSHIIQRNFCMFYCGKIPRVGWRLLGYWPGPFLAGPRCLANALVGLPSRHQDIKIGEQSSLVPQRYLAGWWFDPLWQIWKSIGMIMFQTTNQLNSLKVSLHGFSVAFTVRHRNCLFDTLSCTDSQDSHCECLTK